MSSEIVPRSALLWSVCHCKVWILYGKSLRSSKRILKTDVLEIPVSCERRRVNFLGNSSRRFCKFWIFSEIMLNNVDHCGPCEHLPPKLGHQTLNCPSIRYIVPAKISPALLLCQKNWLCCKVCLDDFYPLLRSIASSWIHIGVKGISPRLAVYTTWKIWKKKL